LLEGLEELGVEPDRVRIPGQLYDSMVADAEESMPSHLIPILPYYAIFDVIWIV